MNYSDFISTITKRAEKTAGKEGHVYVNQIIKNNDTKLDGLVIMEKGHTMAPTIYLNDYYPKYKDGMSIDNIMDEILSSYYMSRDSFELNLDHFKSYDKMRHRIVYKLVNYKKNKELLKTVPHKNYLDLAVVYYAVLSDNGGRIATALIHDSHLKAWNIDFDVLDKQAKYNTPRLLRATIKPIEKVLSDIARKNKNCTLAMDEYEDCKDIFPDDLYAFENDISKSMYVLTNASGMNGAACLLYEKPLSCFGERIQRDFFVLPSSVHEVILVPKYDGLKREDLLDMVVEINKTGVSSDEVLSDNVYEYDFKDRVLKI